MYPVDRPIQYRCQTPHVRGGERGVQQLALLCVRVADGRQEARSKYEHVAPI